MTGATGLLGRYLLRSSPEGVEVTGLSREPHVAGLDSCVQLDLANLSAVEEALDLQEFDVLVHAAAEGNVDRVESAPEEYAVINAVLPGLLAEIAHSKGAHFVHVSSNAVFGGREYPYSDHDLLSPVNHYGALKARAEEGVIRGHPTAAIVRPILMYGWPNRGGRTNIAQFFLGALQRGESVNALADVFTEPLYAADAARVVWSAVDRRLSGPINVSGGELVSIHQFASLIAAEFGYDSSLINPVDFNELASLSPRPMVTRFSLERLASELGYVPRPPREGLAGWRNESSSKRGRE